MSRRNKHCDTCTYEPDWEPHTFPSGESCVWGLCKFPRSGMQVCKAIGLPQGASINVPRVRRDEQKKQCPAWRGKDA